MHNQNRSEYKARLRDKVISQKLAKQAKQWNVVSTDLLRRRQQQQQQHGVDSKQEATDATGTMKTTTTTSTTEETLETLRLTEKMLTINPDPVYIWNHRMELLLSLTTSAPPSSGTSSSEESKEEAKIAPETFIRNEQNMTTSCLQRNPKAYGAWFHRKWAVRHWMETMVGYPNETCRKLLETELDRCADFLDLDERNFHCWSYRRFVVAALASAVLDPNDGTDGAGAGEEEEDGVDGSWTSWCYSDNEHEHPDLNYGTFIGAQIKPQLRRTPPTPPDTTTTTNHNNRSQQVQNILLREWNFTTDKIRQNFSNGSAFHHRSKLLPLLYPHASCRTQPEIVSEELELINNAVYTEPDDQTPWWYLRFIIEWVGRTRRSRSVIDGGVEQVVTDQERDEEEKAYRSMLREQYNCVKELVDAEEGSCKWGLLGMNTIATILFERPNVEGDHGDEEVYDWKEEARGSLEALIVLDPDRVVRYRDMMKRYD